MRMRTSSDRLTLSPTNRWAIGWVVVSAIAVLPLLVARLGGFEGSRSAQDAIEDALVAGAAADVP